MKRSIDNVIFDIGNVLTDYREIAFLKDKYDEETALWIAEHSMRSPLWAEVDKGVMSHEEYVELFAENDKEHASLYYEAYKDFKGLVTRRATARPWIRSLKERGLNVYVLSNFSAQAYKDCMDALDFLEDVDGGILSFRDLVIKPSREIYELIISRYDLDRTRSVFIDDTKINLTGAEACGLKTIHYLNQKQAEDELEQMIYEI